MKLGINSWTFPPNLTIRQGFKIAKRAGFDAVELNLSADGYLGMSSSEKEVKELAAAANHLSLELRSISTGLFWDHPLTSSDPATADKAKQVVRRMLEIASWIGADTVLVVPGEVTEDVPYDVAYARALAGLKDLSADAEAAGVCIGVENVWNKFLLSPLEMRDFVDQIGSDHVGAYFDVGNVLISGYPQHWIDILGKRIKKVHVKDFSRAIGTISGFVTICEGDVNWTAVRDALRRIGYDDVVTSETSGYNSLPDLGIVHLGQTLKRIFKEGRR